jgi:hypothetical protein
LSDVGLDGPDAARDIQELRSLLDAFNEAKKTAGITLIKMLVTGLAMLSGALWVILMPKPTGCRPCRTLMLWFI